MRQQEIPKIRCAIYTRKSTEEGLEQEFNSLDAQRESAESYIASQKSQGWITLPQHYDDGGFTGGNIDRPAISRLLEDIDDGKIDCVVVYKVDRLSRSLLDFTKILERFEKRSVSFVSVTQQFNTTNSMGRLTLNILLSFAQFEREVISERTRDKIAMARKKGKYTGGRPVLGYDIAPGGGKLLINETEAMQVRKIFELYLKNRSLLAVLDELEHLGWQTKSWVTRKGKVRQGEQYNKKRIAALLKNPIYIGKIQYEENLYEGEHEAIVEPQVFESVQRMLANNRQVLRADQPNRHGGILKGLLRCKACGCGMGHSTTKKNSGKSYRYYICRNAIVRGWSNCPQPSLPANEIERFVIDEIRSIGLDEGLIESIVTQSQQAMKDEMEENTARLKTLNQELANLNNRLGLLNEQQEWDKISILRQQATITERDITATSNRLEKLKSNRLDAADIREACQKFDPLWDTLSTDEQWRMLGLLLEKVEFDADNESINITFAPGGIKILNEELKISEAV
jgi:site-specific DNA recombinase